MMSAEFLVQVVEHVLRSTEEEWSSQPWRDMLAEPKTLVARFCPLSKPNGTIEVQAFLYSGLL